MHYIRRTEKEIKATTTRERFKSSTFIFCQTKHISLFPRRRPPCSVKSIGHVLSNQYTEWIQGGITTPPELATGPIINERHSKSCGIRSRSNLDSAQFPDSAYWQCIIVVAYPSPSPLYCLHQPCLNWMLCYLPRHGFSIFQQNCIVGTYNVEPGRFPTKPLF